MNQAILCLVGLVAIFVMCSSEPLEKRQSSEPDYPEGKETTAAELESGESSEFCFKECRKVAGSEGRAACNDDELAVGCRTTSFGRCTAQQTFDAQACVIDANSCDREASSFEGRKLKALCCKRTAALFH